MDVPETKDNVVQPLPAAPAVNVWPVPQIVGGAAFAKGSEFHLYGGVYERLLIANSIYATQIATDMSYVRGAGKEDFSQETKAQLLRIARISLLAADILIDEEARQRGVLVGGS